MYRYFAVASLVRNYSAAATLACSFSAAAPSADAARIATTNFRRSMQTLRHSIGLRSSKRAPQIRVAQPSRAAGDRDQVFATMHRVNVGQLCQAWPTTTWSCMLVHARACSTVWHVIRILFSAVVRSYVKGSVSHIYQQTALSFWRLLSHSATY
jgi:hypothetical protein